MSNVALQFNPPPEIMAAMIALEGNAHFEAFMKFLDTRMMGMSLLANRVHDDVQSRWAQGRAQELNEIVLAWEHRQETMEMLRKADREAKARGATL